MKRYAQHAPKNSQDKTTAQVVDTDTSDPLDVRAALPTLRQLCAYCNRGAACFKAKKILTKQKHFNFFDSPLNTRWFNTRGESLGQGLTDQLQALVRHYQEESDALLHEAVAASLSRSAQFDRYLTTWCKFEE